MRHLRIARALASALLPAAIFTIVPTAVPSAAPAAPVSMSLPTPGGGSGTSGNWAGQAVTGGRYNRVSAGWVQPAIRCPGRLFNGIPDATFWVGLDGAAIGKSKTVEQVGLNVVCLGGTPYYRPWWEMYPRPQHGFGSTLKVRPGDHVRASVEASGNTFTLTFADITRGWASGVQKTSRAARKSTAEVIVEAPYLSGHGQLPLANFGKVLFYDARFNGKGLRNFPTESITMMTPKHVVRAKPSELSPNGGRFTVKWHHM